MNRSEMPDSLQAGLVGVGIGGRALLAELPL
jgi:hypothetical protein